MVNQQVFRRRIRLSQNPSGKQQQQSESETNICVIRSSGYLLFLVAVGAEGSRTSFRCAYMLTRLGLSPLRVSQIRLAMVTQEAWKSTCCIVSIDYEQISRRTDFNINLFGF